MLMLCFCIMRKYALKRALHFSFLFVFFQDVKGEDAAITCIPTCADKERLPLVSRKNDHDNTDEHKEAKIVLTFYVERNPWNNSASSFFSFSFLLPAQTLTRNAKIRHCWQLHVLQSQSPIYLSTKDHLFVSSSLPPVLKCIFSLTSPSFLIFSACLSFSLCPVLLMTPNQIYLHYFNTPCWNSNIWYIFNSISSGNVPLLDKSNHSNLETRNALGP